MRKTRSGRAMALATVAGAVAGAVGGVAAQVPGQPFGPEGRPAPSVARWELSAGVGAMAGQGDFGAVAGEGWLIDFRAALSFSDMPFLRAHLAAGHIQYGAERIPVSLFQGTGRLTADLVTANTIPYVGVGPELILPWGPVQPYVNGWAGVSFFVTRTSLSDHGGGEGSFSTINFDDASFGYGFGGGVAVPLGSGGRWLLRVEAQHRKHGLTQYLVPGGVWDDAYGNTYVDPLTSDVAFTMYQIGMAWRP